MSEALSTDVAMLQVIIIDQEKRIEALEDCVRQLQNVVERMIGDGR